MTGQLGFAADAAVRWVDGCQRTTSKSDEESLGGHVVPDVVRVVSEANALDRTVVAGVDELHTFTLAVRDGDELRVGKDRDALRLTIARQAFDVSASLDVDHFDGIVPKRRDVQSLRSGVNRQVVEAPLDAGEVNRPDECQGRLARWG